MRLLDTETGQFVEKHPKSLRSEYAVLSHTWDPQGEQSYQELREIQKRYTSGTQHSQHDPFDSKHDPCFSIETSQEVSPAPMSDVEPTCPVQVPDRIASTEQDIPLENHHVGSNSTRKLALTRSWKQFRRAFHMPRFIRRQRGNHCRATEPLSPSIVPPVAEPTSTNADTYLSQSPPAVDSPPIYCSVVTSEGPSETTTPRSIWDDPDLSPKILNACAIARENGYRYIWIDSCCIDKTSSSELSEAINSMYQWYAHAAMCYAFLADVPTNGDHQRGGSRFRRSRWFTRGWTLQELIAPLHVVFLSKDWIDIGSKYTRADLVTDITGIGYNALLHVEPLDKFSVAQRLSWAAGRQTAIIEDQAYSLLGIFDINMPTLYGEGHRAFRRLQEEIMRRIPDQSLFAWKEACLHLLCDAVTPPPHTRPTRFECHLGSQSEGTSLIAASLSSFREGRRIEAIPHDEVFGRLQHPNLPASDYDFTPHGIRTRAPVVPLSDYLLDGTTFECPDSIPLAQWYLVLLGCEHQVMPEHLLGRIGYIPPSQSGVEFLHSGWASVSPAPRGSSNVFSLFPLSPDTLARCRARIEIKTLYISHPPRADGAVEVARWQPHTALHLVLARGARDALRARGYAATLRARGYAATLRGPDPVARPSTHWLTLAHSEHTIVVEFEHRLMYEGKSVDVRAHVSVSGPLLDCDPAPRSSPAAPCRPEDLRGSALWIFSRPWSDSLSTERIELQTAAGARLAVYLKLCFATQNHYLVEASVQLEGASERAVHSFSLEAETSSSGEPKMSGTHVDIV